MLAILPLSEGIISMSSCLPGCDDILDLCCPPCLVGDVTDEGVGFTPMTTNKAMNGLGGKEFIIIMSQQQKTARGSTTSARGSTTSAREPNHTLMRELRESE